jgi:hypothetical protein
VVELQALLKQSPSAKHFLPTPHRLHEFAPPQSTSVSTPSRWLSMHWLATHWPFRALHALVAQVAFEVQDEPTEQFEVHWHTPPAWQTPLGHEVPAVTAAHVPLLPPVRAPRQLWQLFPLQAVLQHTPEEQLPEAQFAPVEQATPFWLAPWHTPLVQAWPDWH